MALRVGKRMTAGSAESASAVTLVSHSPIVRQVYDEARRVARTNLSVLILGETGSGKEVLARFIHNASQCFDGPFVAVNCAAFTSDLVQAELFGVESRAATGVERRPGKVELAGEGTLFLDEISEMSEVAQASVLRVLEDGEVWRVGATFPRPVSFRTVAASNRWSNSSEDKFAGIRPDLYWRLAGCILVLPPLRERTCDIPILANHFAQQAALAYGVPPSTITENALRLLDCCEWPGNVRQLRQEVWRAVALTPPGERIDIGAFSHMVRCTRASGDSRPTLRETVDHAERQAILRALKETGQDVDGAARLLDVSPSTLYRKMKKLDIRDESWPRAL